MSDQTIIAVISGLVAIAVAIISKSELVSRKNLSIKKDIELYKLLPEHSKTQNDLLSLIDAKVSTYIRSTTEMRRNISDSIGGLFFMAIGAYLSWFFWERGSWWYTGLIFSVILLLAGASMLKEGLTKYVRDEKGKRIKSK